MIERVARTVLYKPWWPIYRSLDWGYAAPTSIGWWVVDDDENIYRVREFYETELDPEEQVPLIRQVDEELATTIARHGEEAGIPRAGNELVTPNYTIADPSLWNLAPRWTKGPGPTLAERYYEAGLQDLAPASNARKPGWQRLRDYLNPKTVPLLFVEERCQNFIRQMASLRRDAIDMEDLERGQEDHAADDARYFVMSRPQQGFRPRDELWQKHVPGSASWHEARHIVGRTKPRYINDPGLGPIRVR